LYREKDFIEKRGTGAGIRFRFARLCLPMSLPSITRVQAGSPFGPCGRQSGNYAGRARSGPRMFRDAGDTEVSSSSAV
jgi:hypothetical protein